MNSSTTFWKTALFALLASSAFGQGIEFRDLKLKEALQAAEDEGKLVFVDAYTDWCGPCKWMAANMFPNEKIGQFYNKHFVCIQMDMEKGEGLAFAKNHSVRAYPTLLFLNREEEELMRAQGASPEVEDYLDNARRAMDPKRNMLYLQAEMPSRKEDLRFMEQYLETFAMAGTLKEEVVREFFLQFDAEEWMGDALWPLIERHVSNVESPVFRELAGRKARVLTERGEAAKSYFTRCITDHLRMKRYRARTEEEKEKFAQELARWQQQWPEDPSITPRMFLLDARLNKDKEQWRKIAMENAQKHFWNDADMLNELAWEFYESTKDKSELSAALIWAERAVVLAPEHHILDTYAHLLWVNGLSEEAIEVEGQAVEKAEEEGADASAYKAFIAEIKQ
jgi:thiol-disulfide isomerase/thioredoxin